MFKPVMGGLFFHLLQKLQLGLSSSAGRRGRNREKILLGAGSFKMPLKRLRSRRVFFLIFSFALCKFVLTYVKIHAPSCHCASSLTVSIKWFLSELNVCMSCAFPRMSKSIFSFGTEQVRWLVDLAATEDLRTFPFREAHPLFHVWINLFCLELKWAPYVKRISVL